jgi:hypothetical protein
MQTPNVFLHLIRVLILVQLRDPKIYLLANNGMTSSWPRSRTVFDKERGAANAVGARNRERGRDVTPAMAAILTAYSLRIVNFIYNIFLVSTLAVWSTRHQQCAFL